MEISENKMVRSIAQVELFLTKRQTYSNSRPVSVAWIKSCNENHDIRLTSS